MASDRRRKIPENVQSVRNSDVRRKVLLGRAIIYHSNIVSH
nr:MAG TPA: hypothetical protein [Caudoviricetes sp.]